MNIGQIFGLALKAGFSNKDAATAAAIAMAESDGDPRAHNDTPPDDSYGLWQINMLGAKGPERRSALGLTSNAQLFDPATNARAAKWVYDRQGWNAWSVYQSGAYKEYADQVLDATGKTLEDIPIVGGAFGAAGDIVGALNQMLNLFGDAAVWISDRDNWVRILQVGGGIALGIVAASIIVKPIVSSTAKTVSPL